MRNAPIFTILFLVFAMMSCDFGSSSESSNNANTDSTEKPVASKPTTTDNWLIIPGKQVGRIQADFNGADIYKMFGEDNVLETEIGLGEGETKKGLIVFPKTKEELQVLFEGNEKLDKIESIKINGAKGSKWKTDTEVQIGTTLEELVKLNGKDFKFYGFEWDYAGKLASWDGGKLSKNLSIFLEPTKEEALFPDLLGDIEFSSNHPKAKEAGLKISSIEIKF